MVLKIYMHKKFAKRPILQRKFMQHCYDNVREMSKLALRSFKVFDSERKKNEQLPKCAVEKIQNL